MNLLIVDDDKYVIEGVMNGVDWDSMALDNVYTALGTFQAKEIFVKYQIHILLCDIEIPNENGLSFVEWVRNQGFQTRVIFFTSYADFRYAQKAIQLESFEYILKPVAYDELTDVIRRAAEAAEKERSREKYREMGQYWLNHQNSRNESFWSKLLSKQKPLVKDEVYQRVAKDMIGYGTDSRFLIAEADYGNPEDWEDILSLELCSNQIKQRLEILFSLRDSSIETIWNETVCRWHVIIQITGTDFDKDRLREDGRAFLLQNQKTFGKKGSLYISEIVAVENAYEQAERMKQMRFQIMGFREDVFFTDEFISRRVSYQKPDLARLELLISLFDKDKAFQYIDYYLNYHASFYEWNEETLQCFMLDVMQLIFSILREHQIEAHQLFAGTKTRGYYEKAMQSIQDMKNFINYLVETSIDYEKYVEDTVNVIKKIEKYIEDNLEKNITRADLAGIVYLNPDYMSRLFKNTKGVSLLSYITGRKMEKAKQLLMVTKEPVCVIATKTGFSSCSYFSKKFKEYYGVLPAEFKKTQE